MQPDRLDQDLNLGLGTDEVDRPPVLAQPTRDHREVEHQRRIGEHQIAEVDDQIRLGADRARQGLPPRALRASILVAATAKSRRLVIEVDDWRNLSKADVRPQDFDGQLEFF